MALPGAAPLWGSPAYEAPTCPSPTSQPRLTPWQGLTSCTSSPVLHLWGKVQHWPESSCLLSWCCCLRADKKIASLSLSENYITTYPQWEIWLERSAEESHCSPCWCCWRHGLLSTAMMTDIGLCNKIIQTFLHASSETSTTSCSSKESCLPSPWINTSCVFWSFQSFISFHSYGIWWNWMRWAQGNTLL